MSKVYKLDNRPRCYSTLLFINTSHMTLNPRLSSIAHVAAAVHIIASLYYLQMQIFSARRFCSAYAERTICCVPMSVYGNHSTHL